MLSPRNSSLSFEETLSAVSLRNDLCVRASSSSFLFFNHGQTSVSKINKRKAGGDDFGRKKEIN